MRAGAAARAAPGAPILRSAPAASPDSLARGPWPATYRAPAWLPGGDAQTIWGAKLARRFERTVLPPRWRRERWPTPDGDFIDVDHLDGDAPGAGSVAASGAHRPPAHHLVLLHGLEGSSASAYAQAFAALARARGWAFSIPHFRGCSGEPNLAPRAYHSGDYEEVGWMLDRLRALHGAPLLAVGVSLGGNALLRWAQEAGDTAARVAGAVAAVSSPLDLAAAGRAIDRGFNRLVYTRMFLSTMKPKALAKLAQHPRLFDEARLRAARTLFEFDNVFTAPLHGFRDTADYWARASARPHLAAIRIPALVLNACNDPFVPIDSLPSAREADVVVHADAAGAIGRLGRQGCVTLWQPAEGGHVGFPGGVFPGQVHGMPAAVCDWLAEPAAV